MSVIYEIIMLHSATAKANLQDLWVSGNTLATPFQASVRWWLSMRMFEMVFGHNRTRRLRVIYFNGAGEGSL